MLGILLDWVKVLKEKIKCKKCNYKSLFAICMLRHLSKCHGIKPNKRDFRFLLKYNFISRLVKFIVACVLIPLLFVLKSVCYFLGELSEIL